MQELKELSTRAFIGFTKKKFEKKILRKNIDIISSVIFDSLCETQTLWVW